jgi:hypothetical protein
VPSAVGRKVTLMVQLAPAARDEPQLLVCAKLVALVPVRETATPVSVVVPRFLNVTVRAELVVLVRWLPKEILVGVTDTEVPLPVRATV